MSTDVVQNAIESLTEERDRFDAAIQALQAARNGTINGARKHQDDPVVGQRRFHGQNGGPKKKPRDHTKRDHEGTEKSRRAVNPPGALRAAIHKSIGRRKTPISLHEITDRVLEAGYKCTSRKNLYSSIFMTAKSDPSLKKTKDGIVLLKEATNGSSGRTKQKDRLRKLVR